MIPEIKKILYSTDLSENARYAFSYAASLANRYDAGITILHVLEDISPTTDNLVVGILGQEKWDELHNRFSKALNDGDLNELRQIIVDQEIVCPVSGSKNWTDVRQFNLMFSTEMGSTAEGASKIYLRPETAQGIFVNYLNVQKTG